MAVVTYKCPNCGGDLQFDPAGQDYKCEYCLSRFVQDELEKMGSEEGDAAAPEGDALVYTCPSCGAEIVTDETTAATFCYYCHNPVVLSGKMKGSYHPDYVIPFAVDKQKATEIFTQWISKKKYVPGDFFAPSQIEKITGVYFPYWLYECEVDAELDGEATKLRTWVAGNISYTETSRFQVTRQGTMQVKHVTRNALKKVNRKLVEGVQPFDMKALKEFHMGYLSGFLAENRDMEKQEFSDEITEEVKQYAKSSVRSEVGIYDSFQPTNEKVDIGKERWEYALFPVWTLTYKSPRDGRIYYFACNGQTGKICGELPVDNRRLAVLFASVFVPLLIVLLIVGYLI